MPAPIARSSRRFTRFDLDRRVRITLVGGAAPVVLHGRTCDISEGGLRAVISGQLTIGDAVVVEITSPEEGILCMNAVVCHASGFYYGFEFSQLSQPQSASLTRFIMRNAIPHRHSSS